MTDWSAIVGPAFGAFLAVVGGSAAAWYLSRIRAGRLNRTLDQATKVIEFVERWDKLMSKLQASQTTDPAVTDLMTRAASSVTEDFVEERRIFQEFGGTKNTARELLWLRIPSRPRLWIPQVAVHVLLLLAIFIIVRRSQDGEWGAMDFQAIAFSLLLALSIRIALRRIV